MANDNIPIVECNRDADFKGWYIELNNQHHPKLPNEIFVPDYNWAIFVDNVLRIDREYWHSKR